jgi:hypothetical protein
MSGARALAQGEVLGVIIDGKKYPSQPPPSFTAEYLTTFLEPPTAVFKDPYVYVRFARDSQGRTRREEGQSFGDRPISDLRVSVVEPVARFDARWLSSEGHLQVTHWAPVQTCPDPSFEVSRRVRTAVASGAAPAAPRPTQPVKPTVDPEKSQGPIFEDLGTKNIFGIEAKGTRITEHIPAGARGNAEAFVLVTESWSAWGYGVLEEISEDRTHGTMSMKKVFQLEIGEPDPQLFTLPQGMEAAETWTEPTPCPGDSARNRGESPLPHSSQ